MSERLARTPFATLVRAIVVAVAVAFCASSAARAAGASSAAAPDFTLVDQHGKDFRLSNYRGKPVVLFFGYTHCPDVCPTILANLKRARVAAGAKAADTVVALVTLDPKRDTAKELGEYVANFDPSFLGLRGDDAALRNVYRAYHVQFSKQPQGRNDYLISHTAFVYYIGRDGRIRALGLWNDTQSILEKSIEKITSPG